VLTLVLRRLPREALIKLRVTCRDVCDRISTLISCDRTCNSIGFERQLRMPANFDRVVVAAFLQRLCSRFGIRMDTWSLILGVRVQLGADGYVLSCNGMSACEALAAVAVTSLDIRLAVIGKALGVAGAEALAPVLGTIAHLTSLDLGDLSLGAAGLASLGPVLSKMTKLVSLHLERNNLGAAGTASWAALSTMPDLTSPHLDGNNLGAAGSTSLVPALSTMTQLRSLHLDGNALGAAGAASLTPALSKMTNFT